MDHKHLSYPQTTESAYKYFHSRGMSIRQWARVNELPYNIVKDVLMCRSKGIRGKSHHVAVALGLKPNPEQGVKEG